MKLLFNHIKDAVDYTFGDINAILIVSTLMTLTSIINKNDFIHPIWSVFSVTMFFVMGYGSYISWYAIKGSNKHPGFDNPKALFREGLKKSFILSFYSFALTFFIHNARANLFNANLIMAVFFTVLFLIVYIIMIGGLINRYLNNGDFFKAFDVVGIVKLISLFDKKIFIKLLISAVIAHIFSISVIIDFHKGFSIIELLHSLLSFFLAPFLFIMMKRFVGLNVHDLVEDMEDD